MDSKAFTGRCQCALCVVDFDNLEQLDRHLASHDNRRPIICQFCERLFTRSDALSRHWKTCRTRLDNGAPIPSLPQRTRGKKRKACDRCMRLKRACNAGLPCNTCISKQHQCFYTSPKEKRGGLENLQGYAATRDQHANDLINLPCLDLGLTSPSSSQLDRIHPTLSPPRREFQYWPALALSPTLTSWSCELDLIPPQPRPSPGSKFEFLVRHTGSTGLISSFNCRIVSAQLHPSLSETLESETFPNASLYDLDDSQFAFGRSETFEPTSLSLNPQMIYPKSQHLNGPANGIPDPFHEWAVHPLALKTEEIVARLKETIRYKHRRSPVTLQWSPLVEQMCFQFFSPPNLHRYLEAFWVSWYPNCPIVHKPSFNPNKASPILMASMAIIGSCTSPNIQDNQNAQIWLNAVEEMVFDDESLQEVYLNAHANENASWKSKKLGALQAAFFVCIFQNWEGSEITQRRIRRHRYSTVVAAARDLNPGSAIHRSSWLMDDALRFDWQAFIQKEETIRTLSYVFLLDTAFVIFYNTPARIIGPELEMHINCPESAFQAGSAIECFMNLKNWAAKVRHHPSVSAAIETICQSSNEVSIREAYIHFGLLNMFVIISALCQSIYQLHNALASSTAFENIERGMKNWKHAWDQMHGLFDIGNCNTEKTSDPGSESWKRDGFMKSASEYWLLGTVLLESVRSDDGEKSDLAKRTLSKYDQTNMGQMRQLIAEFNAMKMA